MTAPANDAFQLAAQLAKVLEHAQIPYAIGGAIAYGLWGDPRGTLDVDLNVFVGHDRVPAALDALEGAGVHFDREAALRADLEGDVLVGRAGSIRVDVFTPSIPFSWEAGRTAVRAVGPHGEASFLSAEATAVFKLLFFRNKDLVDLEKLVAVQESALDRAYVRRWVAEMMGEDDPRVAFWDRVCGEHPLPG